MIVSRISRPVGLALAVVAAAVAATGCGASGGAGSSCGTSGAVGWAQASPIFTKYCTRCHSSTLSGGARGGAPTSVDYDTYASASAWASAGVSSIEAGSMPFDNPGSVSSSDLCVLEAWVEQGAKQ